MAAPPSQKYRQIGFYLEGGGDDVNLDLVIRPEELTRQEMTRLQAQQTLGGAWIDEFGAGLGSINISGHTGWRGSTFFSGEDAFQQLRSTVFRDWLDRRARCVASGVDPDTVSLYFLDSLDSIRSKVAARTFTLRRSKSRPLLMMFQIQLVELADADQPESLIDEITDALSNPLRWLAGVTGLGNQLVQIQHYVTAARSAFGSISNAIRSFVDTGTSLIQSVQSTAQDLRGQFDVANSALLGIGASYSHAASNAFHVLAADDTLPSDQRIAVMALASNFQDAACTMENSFNAGKYFRSFDDLFGASTCSSTGGGHAWSTFTEQLQNPFYSLYPPVASRLAVTPDAQAAIVALRADPIPLIGQPSQVGALMAAAGGGVTVP